MAKMVGMNVVVKEGWTKKAIALLSENLTEEEYKAALNEHLSFEIDSAINLRKAREILMRVWYRDTEGVEKLQKEGRAGVCGCGTSGPSGCNQLVHDRVGLSRIRRYSSADG